MSLMKAYIEYHESCEKVAKLDEVNAKRESLLKLSRTFKSILVQQESIKSLNAELKSSSTTKPIAIEKEVPSSKINPQNTSDQIMKLNKQLSQSKMDIDILKQSFASQKTVLEAKLDSAKATIQNIKQIQSMVPASTRPSPSKHNTTNQNHSKLLVSKNNRNTTFSTSPFLKRISKPKSPNRSGNLSFMSPTINSMIKSKIMAASTPTTSNVGTRISEIVSPSKNKSLTHAYSPRKGSSLSKVMTVSKKSLFDFDEEEGNENEDIFNNSFKKMDTSAEPNSTKIKQIKQMTLNINKSINLSNIEHKRKRKLSNLTGVNIDESENLEIVTPIKRFRNQDSVLDEFSPLRSTKRRNVFKV